MNSGSATDDKIEKLKIGHLEVDCFPFPISEEEIQELNSVDNDQRGIWFAVKFWNELNGYSRKL